MRVCWRRLAFLCESFQLEIGSGLGTCVHSCSKGWDSICLAHMHAASVISLFTCGSCHVLMVLFAWCWPSPLSLRLVHLILCIDVWSLKVDLVRTFHLRLSVLILLLFFHCLVVGLCVISHFLQKETSHCCLSVRLHSRMFLKVILVLCSFSKTGVICCSYVHVLFNLSFLATQGVRG